MEISKTDIFLVNVEDRIAASLMRKLRKHHPKPGAIIPLTNEEFELFKKGCIAIRTPNLCSNCINFKEKE